MDDDFDPDVEEHHHDLQIAANGGSVIVDGVKPPPAATRIVSLALELYDLGISTEGEPFALPKHRPNVGQLLRGHGSLRAELAAKYLELFGKVPSQSALTDALLVVEGIAQKVAPRRLDLRVARDGDRAVLDLGDATGRVVIIDRFGWRIVDQSPLIFHRTRLTSPLPEPSTDGDLELLREVVNVTSDAWPCAVAWLVQLLVGGPQPILGLNGRQGHGKSSTEKKLANLLDPSPAPLRAMPRDVDQWAIAAAASTVVPIDNVSGLSPTMSDVLCRAATGDGFLRRTLYSDSGVSVLSFRRAVILSSIDLGAMRGDLGERLLSVELDRIDPTSRRTEQELEQRWTDIHQKVLGGLLDVTVEVFAALPDLVVDRLGRMADYSRVLAAVDHVLGTEGQTYYLRSEERIAVEVLDSEPVFAALTNLIGAGDDWEGTFGDLLALLTSATEHRGRGWPTNAKALSGTLERIAEPLRRSGWTFERTGKTRAGAGLHIVAPEDIGDAIEDVGDPDEAGAQDDLGDAIEDVGDPDEAGAQDDLGDASDANNRHPSLLTKEKEEREKERSPRRTSLASPASPDLETESIENLIAAFDAEIVG